MDKAEPGQSRRPGIPLQSPTREAGVSVFRSSRGSNRKLNHKKSRQDLNQHSQGMPKSMAATGTLFLQVQ